MITSSGSLHPRGRFIPDGLDEALVRLVVDDFYRKARLDPVVGPIFNRVIADGDWPTRLDRIATFWSSMLLGTGTHSGHPMPKHLAIPELEDRHFERWLSLFKQTVDELCLRRPRRCSWTEPKVSLTVSGSVLRNSGDKTASK